MRRGFSLTLAAALLLVYGACQTVLKRSRTPVVAPELLVSLPIPAQVLLAAGDRHLAAVLSGLRVLVADTSRMAPADYAVQARLQQDVAWLDPAHEDNYYIAANILPWGGQVAAAEKVLIAADGARPTDFLPAFHIGFIHYHFYRDPAAGAQWLLKGARRAVDQGDAWGLQVVAAKWIERGYDTATAARMVGAMAKSAPPGGFRRYVGLRAQRLEQLASLREATRKYRERTGHPPASLEALVVSGMIEVLPKDPLNIGFTLSPGGEPVFKGSSQ